MITNFEKGIINLIKSSLNGEVAALSEDFDFEKAYEFAQNRQITPLLYYGASELEGFMDSNVGKKFLQSTMRFSFYSETQLAEIEGVLNSFRENKIDFLAVKGTILKPLYPYSEMRLMSDADLLIKEEQYEKIKGIMSGIGFECVDESDHEHVWRKGDFTVELHKRLVPSYNKDYYNYFGDGWRLAIPKSENSCEYVMKNEDCFIYLFTHFSKHYRDAGIGVKHLTDFYVFLKHNKELDWDYIYTELDKLQLKDFWINIDKVLRVWFYDGEWDEKSEFLTLRIFASGAYGTYENYAQSEALKLLKTEKDMGKMKKKRKIHLIFPSYEAMCKQYPVLKRVAILLPFMWVWRWISLVLFRRHVLKARTKSLKEVSDESVNQYKTELNYVGLDFNFE